MTDKALDWVIATVVRLLGGEFIGDRTYAFTFNRVLPDWQRWIVRKLLEARYGTR